MQPCIHVGRFFAASLTLVLFLAYTPLASSQKLPRSVFSESTVGPEISVPEANLLIRNVQLMDRDAENENVTVSILVKRGKLNLVSKDRIPASEAELVVDAQQGVVIGELVIGEPASLMVLDQDPRQDFSVLLDTATHAKLALFNGTLVKNTYTHLSPLELAQEEAQPQGWIAYSPPPLSLPTGYQDAGKWNKWESRYVDGLFAAAIALDRQHWVSQDDDSRDQVGSLGPFEGGQIRGFRFGIVGTLNFPRPWVYTLFAATHAFDKGFDSNETDSITLFDYRLDIPLAQNLTMSVGKQKEPISMERLMSMVQEPMQERSAPADALLPSRNVGVVFSGTTFKQRSTWAGGVFNDWFDANQAINDSATQFVGRMTGLPYISSDEINLLHLGAGVRYSNAREGVRALTEPEFNNAPLYVDTGLFDAQSTTTWQLETSFRSGPVWLAGEYLRANTDAPSVDNPELSGYHLGASWIVTGEVRGYNRRAGILGPVPIARSVYQNGIGAWEVSTRFSHTDLDDGDVEGGKMDIWSLGVNWWLSPFMSLGLNYRFIELDRDGLVGRSNGFNTRLLLILE